MSESIWLPGLLVLGLGLAGGLVAAWKLRRAATPAGGAKKSASGPGTRDLELRVRDLEERREELYDRLRRADAESLSGADQRSLEMAAARTLRDLDRLQAELPATRRAAAKSAGKKSRRKPAAAPTAAAPEPPPAPAPAQPGYATRHPFLVGFLFGAGLLALVGVLVYWAVRDARPDPNRGMPTAGPSAPRAAGDEPHIEGQLPPEVAERLAELENRLAANPDDLLTRKQLALTQLAGNQFFQAFEHATEILRVRPGDPDGLYIQGVVRLTMGQNREAINLLDRVLADYPSHLQAMLYRGLALFQDGRQQQAIETWETGLEMAGGSHPGFEQLLGMAAAGELAPAPGPAPAGGVSAPPPSPAPATPAPPPTDPATEPAARAGDGYPVRVELAPGTPADPNATLFVILRGGPGPPVAVKRLSGARLPLELVLGQDDSMMGGELPVSGTLTVRLDADGSASTTDDGPSASAPAERGKPTRLVLQ